MARGLTLPSPLLSEPKLAELSRKGPLRLMVVRQGCSRGEPLRITWACLPKTQGPETLPAPSENPWERAERLRCRKAAAGWKVLEAGEGLSTVKPTKWLSGCERGFTDLISKVSRAVCWGPGSEVTTTHSVPALRGLQVLRRCQVSGLVTVLHAQYWAAGPGGCSGLWRKSAGLCMEDSSQTEVLCRELCPFPRRVPCQGLSLLCMFYDLLFKATVYH